jgi:flagellar protein FliO/FliZ
MRIFFCFLLLLVFVSPALAEEVAKVTASAPVYTPPDTTASLLKVTLGLGFVVIAIFVSAWLFKRFAGSAFIANDSMRVVGGLSVSQRDRIVLVQIGDEQIVVGVSPGRIQTLHVMKNLVEVPDNQPTSAAFAEKLNAAMKQWKK